MGKIKGGKFWALVSYHCQSMSQRHKTKGALPTVLNNSTICSNYILADSVFMLSLRKQFKYKHSTHLKECLDSPPYVLFSPARRPCGGSLVNLMDICRSVMGNRLWTSVVIHRRKASCTVSASTMMSISSSMKSSPRWQFCRSTHPPCVDNSKWKWGYLCCF